MNVTRFGGLRAVVCAVALSGVLSGFARTYEFAAKRNSGARDFWAKGTWGCGLVPTNDMSYFQLASYAENLELTFSKDVELEMSQVDIKCGEVTNGEKNRFVFNGRNHVFATPDSETSNYNAAPFVAQYWGKSTGSRFQDTYVMLQNSCDSSNKKLGTYRLTNPYFTFDGFATPNTDDDHTLLTFEEGAYNFYDPNGTVIDGYLVFGCAGPASTAVFKPGTSLAVKTLYAGASESSYTDNDHVIFDGATLSVPGTLHVRTGGTVALTNGTAATVGAISVYGAGPLTVDGAATTLAATTFTQTAGTTTLADGTTTVSKVTSVTAGTLLVTNGAVVKVGATATSEEYFSLGGTALLHIAGGSFASSQKSILGPGKLWVTGGSARFNNADTFFGSGSSATSETLVEGGSLYAARFRMGSYSCKLALLRQTGGTITTSISADRSQSGILLCFKNNPCKVQLEGGKTYCSRLRYRFNPEDDDYSAAASANATFVGNGGTLIPYNIDSSASSPFMAYLGSATIGEKGLTLYNQYAKPTYILQNLSNVSGEEGELRFTGAGTVSYEGTNEVSKTVIGDGATATVVQLMKASTVFDTALTVTNGATFSMEGASAAITLTSLDFSGATLRLDPGDVITVSGDVRVKNGMVLNWVTAPTDASGFLVVKGTMDDDTVMWIQNAVSQASIASGTHISVTVDKSVQGQITFKAQVKADAPIAEDKNVNWTGAADAKWSTAGNWEASKPDAESRAVFGDVETTNITLDADAEAGALRFTAGDYTISGTQTLTIAGDVGAGEIAVSSGVQTIDAPLTVSSKANLPIAAGSSLTLAQGVTGSGLNKTGTGSLTLGGANKFFSGLESAGGVVTVKNARALAMINTLGQTHLTGGTMTFDSDEDDDEPMKLVDTKIVTEPTASATTVVFNVRRDIELDSFAMASRAFIKRGPGTMTLNVAANDTVTMNGSDATPNQDGSSSPWVFPEDGSAPVGITQRAGFTVVEGKVVLRGLGENANVAMNCISVIGPAAKVCAVQPELVVSNLTVEFSSSGVWCGSCNGGLNNAVKTPALRLMDGATLHSVGHVQPGYGSDADGIFTVKVTGGSTYRTDSVFLVREPAAGGTIKYEFKDSNFFLGYSYPQIDGKIRGDFDNTFFGSANNFGATRVTFDKANAGRAGGELYFHDGSVFCCSLVKEESATTVTRQMVFAFNDAEWRPYRKNNGDWSLEKPQSKYLVYEMRGKGVIFAPGEDCTYSIYASLTGEGGLTLDGAGTLRLAAGSLDYTGATTILQGTLDAAGQTVNNPTVAFTPKAAVPVLEDCVISGRLLVDCGGVTPAVGAQAVVAKFAGSTSAADLKVKLVNTGADKCAVSAAVDAEGNVTLTVLPRPGTLFFIR